MQKIILSFLVVLMVSCSSPVNNVTKLSNPVTAKIEKLKPITKIESGRLLKDHKDKVKDGELKTLDRTVASLTKADKINWGRFTFNVAQKAILEDKLVFVYVKSDRSPACIVVEGTTLGDENIIKILNDKYIPIIIDIDQEDTFQADVDELPTAFILVPNGSVIGIRSFQLNEENLLEILIKLNEVWEGKNEKSSNLNTDT